MRRWWIALAAVVIAATVTVTIVAWDAERDLECLDETVLPCMAQSVELAIPVGGTDLRLTYSSDRHRYAASDDDMRDWLDQVGLGGWTPDVVHHLDVDTGTVHWGSGGSRAVDPIELTGKPHRGRLAVADGSGLVHLFDRQGTHVASVDELDGRVELRLTYRDGTLRRLAVSHGADLSLRRNGGKIVVAAARGRRAKLRTNSDGHLVELTDIAGARTTLSVGADGLVTKFTPPDSGSYQFSYDEEQRLVAERDPMGVVTRWRRIARDDGHAVVRRASSGAATRWTITRTDGGHTVTLRGPDGSTAEETARPRRHTVRSPDGAGYDIRLAPDPRWRMQQPVVRKAKLDLGAGPVTVRSTVEISGGRDNPFAVDSIRETTDVGGDIHTREWRRDERRITVTTPEGRVRRIRLDDDGRATALAWGDVRQELSYGSQGELTAVGWNGDDGPRFRFSYDPTGVQINGPEGTSHRLGVDDAGRVTASKVAPSGGVTVDRLASGAVAAVHPEAGGKGELAYTSDGRLKSFRLGGKTIRTWRYDAHGRPAGFTDGAGRDIAVSYDARSRPVRVKSGGDVVEIEWQDSTGQPVAFNGETVRLTRGYQGSALVKERWSGATEGTVARTLDERLRVAEIAVGDTRLPISHDADGLVSAVGDARIERDPASGAIRRIQYASVIEERDYDSLGGLSAVTVTAAGRPVYQLRLTRDQLGRVTKRRERMGTGQPRTTTMRYDEFGQLTRVAVDGTVTERYRYDELGNRIRMRSANRLPTLEHDDAGRIVREGDTRFEYDDAGYLVSRSDADGTVRFDYGAFGELREVKREGGPAVRYEHDPQGRRVAARSAGTPDSGLLYLDGQRPAAMVGAGGVDGVFGYGESSLTPTTMTKGGDRYRIIADDTGSPRLVVDAETGKVAQRIDYTAFGQITEDTAPGFQPFAFGGGIVDPVSGLVRFGHRDYDPSSGRWTAPDPIGYAGGDTNLYRYTRNDPVNLSDPSGLSSHKWFRFGCELLRWAIRLANCAGEDIPVDVANPETAAEVAKPQNRPFSRRTVGPRAHGAPVTGGVKPSRGKRFVTMKDRVRKARFMRRYRAFWERHFDDLLRNGRYADAVRLTGRARHFGFGLFGGSLGIASEIASWASDMARDLADALKNLDFDLPGSDDKDGEQRWCTGAGVDYSGEGTAPFTFNECRHQHDGDSSVYGDPHLRTIDGVRTLFQAAGEFVYVDNRDVKIQTRFEGKVGHQTLTTATAIKAGDHVLEVIYDEVKKGSTGDAVSVRLDGKRRLIDGVTRLPSMTIAVDRANGIEHVYVETSDGWLVSVGNHRVSQDVVVAPPDKPGTVRGLFGTPNDERSDDLMLRNGKTLPLSTLDTVKGRYGTYARAWRVRAGERLFTDTPAEKWTTKEMTALPDVVLSLGDLPPKDVQAARKVCVDAGVPAGPELEDCTYDVAVSGKEAWAAQQAASNSTRRPGDNRGEERKADHPLFVAAHNCRLDDLKALLNRDTDVSIQREKDGWTALLFASQHNCPEIVAALLKAGADPTTPNYKGFSPLYLAAQNGRTAVARLLLDAGAPPEQALPSGDTPLLIATFNGHTGVVRLLLRNHADPNIARADGVTPVLAAAQEGSVKILRSLVAAGADVNRSTFERLTTPLHLASDGDLNMLSALLKAGAKVNRRDSHGNTALHYAASEGNADNVRLLLASGADQGIRNNRGDRPRDVADESVKHLFR